MTVVGIITTIGLILALAYALKRKTDHVVYSSWGWLFVCMCASTAAVANGASPSHYVWWYGIPAVLAMGALIRRFVKCCCFDWRGKSFVALFGINTLALALGLQGLHLFAGVTLLAVTVWAQIILVFLMARARPCEVIEVPATTTRTPRNLDLTTLLCGDGIWSI